MIVANYAMNLHEWAARMVGVSFSLNLNWKFVDRNLPGRAWEPFLGRSEIHHHHGLEENHLEKG